MRFRRAVLACLALALAPLGACNPPAASGASITVFAVGDTAKISFHWGAVNKATSYTYTISAVASNGSWAGLPTNNATSSTSGQVLATSSTADSAVFQICATAVGAAGSSPVGCSTSTSTTSNTWHRKLQPPAPLVDSVSLRPNPITLQLASSRIVCGFQGFHDGQMAERTADKPSCDSLYRKFSLSHRRPTTAEQAYADTATYQWSTSNSAAIGLLPNFFGSSAVTVTGNGLTLNNSRWFAPERYASSVTAVARIDSTYTNPDGTAGAAVTCLTVGTQSFVVQVEGRRAEFSIDCKPSLVQTVASR